MTGADVRIRPLEEAELGEADRIMRLAFGTFLGLREPASFMGDADYVRTRWAADPTCALAAEDRPQLIGVKMHRPDESPYHDDSAWVIDDWR